jgi:hypothetical protein
MSDLELSSGTRSLLAAAKKDGPSALAKAKIWGGVAATTAAAAGAGASAGGAAAMGTGKLMLGALFGSAITVGLAVALMHIGPLAPDPGPPRADMQLAAPRPVRDPVAPALPTPSNQRGTVTLDSARTPALVPLGAGSGSDGLSTPSANANAPGAPRLEPPPTLAAAPIAAAPAKPKPTARASRSGVDRDDLLERESLLVAESRGALVRGDARAALSAVRAAQALDSHALDPEELSLETRALRALGAVDEAAVVEAKLKAKYPDHALAR